MNMFSYSSHEFKSLNIVTTHLTHKEKLCSSLMPSLKCTCIRITVCNYFYQAAGFAKPTSEYFPVCTVTIVEATVAPTTDVLPEVLGAGNLKETRWQKCQGSKNTAPAALGLSS